MQNQIKEKEYNKTRSEIKNNNKYCRNVENRQDTKELSKIQFKKTEKLDRDIIESIKCQDGLTVRYFFDIIESIKCQDGLTVRYFFVNIINNSQ